MPLQVIDRAIQPSALWKTVTPSDSTVLVGVLSVYVGTGGDLACTDYNGDVVVFKNVPDGTVLPIAPVKINSTSTTASDIVILQ